MTPNAYAVVMDDKSAPNGFWFVGCYHHRDIAEQLAAKPSNTQQPCRVVPMFFVAPEAGLIKDAERYRWLRLHGNDVLIAHNDYDELPQGAALDKRVDEAMPHYSSKPQREPSK